MSHQRFHEVPSCLNTIKSQSEILSNLVLPFILMVINLNVRPNGRFRLNNEVSLCIKSVKVYFT